MINFTDELHDELHSKLEMLDHSNANGHTRSDEKMQLIYLAIDRLRQKLKTFEFEIEEEEIFFFKYQMPQFIAKYIYESQKYMLDMLMITGSQSYKVEYLESLSRRMDEFFQKNQEFIQYYNEDKTELDREYFLCLEAFKSEKSDLINSVTDFSREMFHCVNAGMLIAYNDLIIYARNIQVEQLMTDAGITKANKLKWTDSVISLTELIYCLQLAGSFNNGKANLKQITEYFAKVFGIKLRNTSSTFQKMLARKKSDANYLDHLKKVLNEQIVFLENQRNQKMARTLN